MVLLTLFTRCARHTACFQGVAIWVGSGSKSMGNGGFFQGVHGDWVGYSGPSVMRRHHAFTLSR